MTSPGQQDRLLNVDALRGLALLGILSVNIWAFADSSYATASHNPAYTSALDNAVRFLVSLVFETKFYLLFSFLFGYSFTLQMFSAQRAGESFRARMWRRQAGLLTIGLLHGFLFYYGEILAIYAVLGLLLLACHSFPPRRAMAIGLVLPIAAGTVWILVGLAELAGGGSMVASAPAAEKALAFAGNAATTVSFHAGHFPGTVADLLVLQGPSVIAMFFLGFAAGRMELLAKPQHYARMFRRILQFGLPVGLLGAACYASIAVYAPGSAWEVLAFGIGEMTAPLLTAAYVTSALVLFRRRAGGVVEHALAPMGKMALSNYLMQSVLLGLLFTGYGLRLIDRLPPIAVLLLVATTFISQLAVSRWWLARHQYGPAEWLLRMATLARIPQWTLKEIGGQTCERAGSARR